MISRRKLLSGVPLAGAASALSLPAFSAGTEFPSLDGSQVVRLGEGWRFRLDPSGATSPPRSSASSPDSASGGWQSISVPHTWQALGSSPEYVGVAWYRTQIFAPESWRGLFVRVEFEAVYHTAHVFLNGEPIGEHVGKGYTAFTCDLSQRLHYGQHNELQVRVDNTYSDRMVPRMQSFDWADDGGITRPVQLLITPLVFIERLEIEAVPDLESHTATVSICAVVRNTSNAAQSADVSAATRPENSTAAEVAPTKTQARLPAASTTRVQLPSIRIEAAQLWHFDAPNLYLAHVSLQCAGFAHSVAESFGIRKFEVRGTAFYLNGERVVLMGVERMAGSHPQFGMAEPGEWIEANHRDLKELNCVFTRVHWPQDKRVLDFCDRHGILMQEEVPAWGSFTFHNIPAELQSQLETNGLEQLREMVARDRNHPSIVSWGLCNEVDGKNPNSRAFAHALAAEARRIDPSRLLTYASHTLGEHPEQDMAGDFDFISGNEYFGSWSPGGPEEVRQYVAGIRRAFPNKPIVVSEYGWCECQAIIPPGDENRVKIVNEHTRVLRESGDVAGAIYFDYNDYRTLVGDKGTGAFRQRVHGVVDVYAGRKPSFDALRREASPIKTLALSSSADGFALQVETRDSLPSYTLRGYAVRWVFYGYDGLPMDGELQRLGPLTPGSSVTLHSRSSIEGLTRVVVDILRPTGFSAATAEMRLGNSA
jgi:beta-galactosidase